MLSDHPACVALLTALFIFIQYGSPPVDFLCAPGHRSQKKSGAAAGDFPKDEQRRVLEGVCEGVLGVA